MGHRMGDAAADVVLGGAPDRSGGVGAVYREIDPAVIERNPRQPRQVFDEEALAELVHSIREFGLMQPIVVRAVPGAHGWARYQLVMGERRWRAAQEAGLATIPAIVRETADDSMLRDALLENIHRAQLNPLGRGRGLPTAARRVRCHPRRTRRPHRSVAPADHQHDPAAAAADRGAAPRRRGRPVGRPCAGTARARGRPGAQEELAARIVAEGLSVRATEEAVTLANRGRCRHATGTPPQADPDARPAGRC